MSEKPEPNSLGAPSIETVKSAWDGAEDKSVRKVAAALQDQGYEISYSTIQRYVKNGFTGKRVSRVTRANEARKKIEKAAAASVVARAADKKDGESKSPETVSEAMAGVAAAVAGPIDDAMAAEIEATVTEFQETSDTELERQLKREVMITSIVMTRMQRRRAASIIFIGKETGALVDAIVGSAKDITLQGKGEGLEPVNKPGDPTIINGTAVDITPSKELTPLQKKIAEFDRRAGITVAAA